jgi:hypothetical protein
MTNEIEPSRQAIAAKDRSGKLTVSGKLKIAIDLMLEGSRRDDAAKQAGMTPHGLREAMKKAHVRGYFNSGLQVMRESERARNVLALATVRDTSSNDMARVSAAKALEQIADPTLPGGSGGGRARSGWVIDVAEPTVAGLVIVVREQVPANVTGLTIDAVANEDEE